MPARYSGKELLLNILFSNAYQVYQIINNDIKVSYQLGGRRQGRSQTIIRVGAKNIGFLSCWLLLSLIRKLKKQELQKEKTANVFLKKKRKKKLKRKE